ncbi:hypothetical protein KSF78_0000418 [Schistosoma japonicum]|nr:hypothetical protein KSF78_0000418 [Schistosoma japonicum]
MNIVSQSALNDFRNNYVPVRFGSQISTNREIYHNKRITDELMISCDYNFTKLANKASISTSYFLRILLFHKDKTFFRKYGVAEQCICINVHK